MRDDCTHERVVWGFGRRGQEDQNQRDSIGTSEGVSQKVFVLSNVKRRFKKSVSEQIWFMFFADLQIFKKSASNFDDIASFLLFVLGIE